MVRIYTQPIQAEQWLQQYRGQPSLLACVFGFTETGLIPGISAAGATPDDRRYTAIADAEFLMQGVQAQPRHPLPPLQAGASPVFISRAVVEGLSLPLYLFNAGLPQSPNAAVINLGGCPAKCLSSGQALPLSIVQHLLTQGLYWGERLAATVSGGYVILGECVVGGTTTALAVLLGLGIPAIGKVNSSHPTCNHAQKHALVEMGLHQAKLSPSPDPRQVVAAVGDPMQIVVAGMAIAASRTVGVLLAGGTQMLAVYALAQAMAQTNGLVWQPHKILVGTTRWVAEDSTGDTVGLAQLVNTPLMATGLNFSKARMAALQAYEQGFVKEGVAAGGCAIAAELQGWPPNKLLEHIETLIDRHQAITLRGLA